MFDFKEKLMRKSIFFFPGLGETKAFKCDGCPKSYSYPSGLSQHKKYECGVVPRFRCSICGRLSKQKFNLKKHYINVHGGVPPEESFLFLSSIRL
jgi:hypothetical protein